jgi:hypothetical protein
MQANDPTPSLNRAGLCGVSGKPECQGDETHRSEAGVDDCPGAWRHVCDYAHDSHAAAARRQPTSRGASTPGRRGREEDGAELRHHGERQWKMSRAGFRRSCRDDTTACATGAPGCAGPVRASSFRRRMQRRLSRIALRFGDWRSDIMTEGRICLVRDCDQIVLNPPGGQPALCKLHSGPWVTLTGPDADGRYRATPSACSCPTMASANGFARVHREGCPHACACPVAQSSRSDQHGTRVRHHLGGCPIRSVRTEESLAEGGCDASC